MNMLRIIDGYKEKYQGIPSILVSGIDTQVKDVVYKTWFDIAYNMIVPHIVIDLSKMSELKYVITRCGINIESYLPGDNCFSVFDGDDMDSEDRLRIWMENAGWTEEKKDKAIAYIIFLSQIDAIETGRVAKFGMELISKYSAPKEFECIIQQWVNQNIIDTDEQICILGKYSELSPIAPELENLIIGGSILQGTAKKNEVNLDKLNGKNVLYVHLAKVHDEMSQKKLLNAVEGKMENYIQTHNILKPLITIYSKGKSTDSVILQFIRDIAEFCNILFVTDNIYAINNSSEIEQNFPMKIYSRHAVMNGAQKVEESFGNIYVRKKSYAIAKDMHLRSRSLIDTILGTDVVKTESLSEPRPEAKYKKEDIISFPPGYCIFSYEGQDMITVF